MPVVFAGTVTTKIVGVGGPGEALVGQGDLGVAVDQARDVLGGGEAAVVDRVVRVGAVDRLDAGDVVGGQALLDVVVVGVHHGRRDGRVVDAQRVAELVEGDRLEVVVAVDLPGDVRVEDDVAGGGPAVVGRRQERERQGPGRLRDHRDPDVAEPGVVLLVAVDCRGPRRCRRRGRG